MGLVMLGVGITVAVLVLFDVIFLFWWSRLPR
jgi:hypothetical protein